MNRTTIVGLDEKASLEYAESLIYQALEAAGEALGDHDEGFTHVHALLWDCRPEMTKPRRRPIPASLRARVMERDEYACVDCGTVDSLQLDHTIPLSKGGPDIEANLRVLCGPCNRAKGAQ